MYYWVKDQQFVNIYAFDNRKMLAIALQLIGATGAHAAINAHKELRWNYIYYPSFNYKVVKILNDFHHYVNRLSL